MCNIQVKENSHVMSTFSLDFHHYNTTAKNEGNLTLIIELLKLLLQNKMITCSLIETVEALDVKTTLLESWAASILWIF